MKTPACLPLLLIGMLVLCVTQPARATHAQPPTQTFGLERALGQWRSTERFEDEPRITVGFRNKSGSLEGWAVLLGQQRKTDDRATLALSFCKAAWDGRRFLFSTILPDDEGTIGWELRVTTPTTAVLAALTEDGQPMQHELKWNMTK